MADRLIVSGALRRALFYEAVRALPEECCGVLLGRREATGHRLLTHILPAGNVAVSDRRHRYTLDPRALLVAERWGAQGLRVLGVYHSHPDAAPVPSAADHTDVVDDWSYLIIGRRENGAPTLRSYRGARGDLVNEEIWYDLAGGGEDRARR